MYVNQLPKKEQEKIILSIRQNLTKEGYSKEEIEEALSDALCSKVSDITHVLK
jgi:uncharacterized membrane-anchored protein